MPCGFCKGGKNAKSNCQSAHGQEHRDHRAHGGFLGARPRGSISGTEFLTIFTTIIAFYFGTQTEKKKNEEVS